MIYTFSLNQHEWDKKIEIRNQSTFDIKDYVEIEKELEFKVINGNSSQLTNNIGNSNLFFTEKFHPKILEIRDGEVKKSYFFNFQKSNLNYTKGEAYQMMDIYRQVKNENLNSLTGNLVAIEDNLL
ncbi:hypothetical protein Belba_1459 [Belliella baltica DSM 15883]|uniref:Uncharacterized protein n=1 Tax=Belliella baltica (strain DSM 15883 / CIP 108006 / LMG 21964 / BA134) TaxID=866536 RepID=I3Z4A8_BELBD|nr:hypothetical protein [Belliella baltica]AFL84076.1 hypothetical protein Belba_1459 [Belliella baltica DSM 15883]